MYSKTFLVLNKQRLGKMYIVLPPNDSVVLMNCTSVALEQGVQMKTVYIITQRSCYFSILFVSPYPRGTTPAGFPVVVSVTLDRTCDPFRPQPTFRPPGASARPTEPTQRREGKQEAAAYRTQRRAVLGLWT